MGDGVLVPSPMFKRLAVIAAVAVIVAIAAGVFYGPARIPQANAAGMAALAEALPSVPREASSAAAGAVSQQGGVVDYFLQIEGIEGESSDIAHRGEIEILSWSWGESQSGTGAAPGAGAGRVNKQDFEFTAHFSKASPQLMLAVASGRHIPSATLIARRGGDQAQEFLTIELTDVLVSSYQTGDASGALSIDSFSLSFSAIRFAYRPQKEDGALDAPVVAGWDFATNRPI